MINQNPFSYKVIVIGDSGVGKTSIVIRESRDQYSYQMAPTIGTSHIKLVIPVEDNQVELKIWDTAGQEQFAPLVSMYARGAVVCVIVASCVDHASINNIELWLERLKEANEDPVIIIAINKIDMIDPEAKDFEAIKARLHSKYDKVFMVSAKTSEGVHDLFNCVAKEAYKLRAQHECNSVDVNAKKSKDDTKGCC